MLDSLPRFGHRIALRRLFSADLSDFQNYRHDKDVGRFQGWTPQTDEEALAFITAMSSAILFRSGEWVQLGIADRGTNALIGDIGIRVSVEAKEAEIGFTLVAQVQRRGLATEAVTEAIALIFEQTKVGRVVAITDARNLPSIRLLERLGMHRIASENAVFQGEPCIEYVYELAR